MMLDKTQADSIRKKLTQHGVTPTPVRILVYRCLEESGAPLSLTEIETSLDTVDRSTVSRTLLTFRLHKVVHAFNDGSGSLKYELCHSDNDNEDDLHVHFRCGKCGKTICLNDLKIPEVTLPEGFRAISFNYVVTGLCDRCNENLLV